MHAARRVAKQFAGLPHIVEPANAFFVLDRHTRVGLIFFLSALVPLNFSRDQNLIAVSPSGNPSLVTARLECIKMPHAV
jgi:hypothetical protein